MDDAITLKQILEVKEVFDRNALPPTDGFFWDGFTFTPYFSYAISLPHGTCATGFMCHAALRDL